MESAIKIIIERDKCDGCGLCVSDCLQRTLEIRDGKAQVLSDNCLKCGHCLAICPMNAVRMEGVEDEILETGGPGGVLDADALKAHLKLRRSVRRYKPAPVEREKLEKIIEAGRLTPTGRNLQNVRYIVIQNGIDAIEDEVLEQYRELQKQAELNGDPEGFPNVRSFRLERGFLFYNAPALILVVSENNTNACLAAMSMELMAEALGLGTVYIGLFVRPANQNEALRRSLGIAEDENIAICLAVGYPAVTYRRSAPKKPANIMWR